MDLVSNYIGSLSELQSGKKQGGISSGINLDDNTFENILNNQLNKTMEENLSNTIGTFNIPAGIDIGDFDGTKPVFKTETENQFDKIKPINNSDNSQFLNFKNNEFSSSEILTFFSSVFDAKPTLTDTSNSGLFGFERKLAANSYDKYARNIITDLSEFVTDALKK